MYPFRDLDLFAGVPPSLIHHQKYAFVLVPAPTSLANSLSVIENSSTLTVGTISQ